MGRAPTPFFDKHMESIDESVKQAREEADTPFDQIYHKEKKLV